MARVPVVTPVTHRGGTPASAGALNVRVMRRKFRDQEHWQESEQHCAALALRTFKFERHGAHRRAVTRRLE